MYNQTYEDYIRSILGYNNTSEMSPNPVNQFNYNYSNEFQTNYTNTSRTNEELEDCYPEIYKIVYPMVRKACSQINTPINREVIEQMTDEIYSAIEETSESHEAQSMQVNVSLTNATRQTKSETNNPNAVNNARKADVKVSENEIQENRSPRRNSIRDIIKILLLRELLGRPHRPRPPMRPPRPPFPGGPGHNRPNPPMMPRSYSYNDIYEF